MTILGQRIRLDPNNVQASFFDRCAGTARFTWNLGLARWGELYEAGEKPSWQVLNKELNATKRERFPWMLDLPWKVPCAALQDLGQAFENFFRRLKIGEKPGYPRFKKRGRCKEAFAIEGRALQFDDRKIKIPKIGWVRTRRKLRFPGKILSAQFTKCAGHWYVSVQVEVSGSWVYPHRCESQAVVGVDLGVRNLAVLSTGEKIEAPRVLRVHEKRLRRLNKELSRRTKGGANWWKTVGKLRRLHEKIANIRKDVTHNLTTSLVQRFQAIGVEDLNVKGMARGLRLGKSIMDAAIAEVRRQLEYKAPLAGSQVVIADRWLPSSKTCNACGIVLDVLPLSFREWLCDCGVVHDRDINAAINLKNLALAQRVTAQRQGSSDVPRDVKLPSGWESGSAVNFG